MKNKRLLWIALYLLWVIVLGIPLLYYSGKVSFPVVATELHQKIMYAVLLLLPLILYAVTKAVKREKTGLIIFAICSTVYFTSFLALVIFLVPDEPLFYPVYSYTESPENYLVLDEELWLYAEDNLIYEVFPEEIPANAEDVSYSYLCDTVKDAVIISASWKTSSQNYEKEKERMTEQYSYRKFGNLFNLSDLPDYHYFLYVAFDDEEERIICRYEQKTDLTSEEKREELEAIKQRVNA